MSFYNLIHGENILADVLLASLNLTRGDFGRYRDCFLTENNQIAVYTRNGGGNRDDYENVFKEMFAHPNYLSDADDDFDNTYATFYFSIPERYVEDFKFMAKGELPTKKWEQALKDLQEGKRPDIVRALAPVFEKIQKELNNNTDEVKVIKI